MRWKTAIFVALLVALTLSTGRIAMAGATGPGPGITGNDTGGVFPYSPYIEHTYKQIAASYCASWGRLRQLRLHRQAVDDSLADESFCLRRSVVRHLSFIIQSPITA
jgi:hypothetical protein